MPARPAQRPQATNTRVVVERLCRRHGRSLRDDVRRGVEACARVWDGRGGGGDGAFTEFCLEQYVPPGAKRRQLVRRLDEFHGAISGGLGVALKVARAGLDIADRPVLAAERILGAYPPASHLLEDYRAHRVACLAQLNFGTDERTPPRSRRGWAERRLGELGREVIPADLLARFAKSESEVSSFVSAYNLHLDRFEFGDARIRFPPGTMLVAHWGLRDYLTSLNGTPGALPRQRAILDLMRWVVDGQIPREVLNNPSVRWIIAEGVVVEGGRRRRVNGHGPLRWEKFHNVWQAQRAIDPYRRYGSVIANKFLLEREIPEDTVVGILTEVVSSPLAARVSRFVRDRLGRELEPFDIYFREFAPRDAARRPRSRRLFPDAGALHAAIPDILARFGWRRARARWIASRIRVDNGRSAGHAWPPYTEYDEQLLRVRVGRRGCDEINFGTFMHELGHCVEGVLSSYEVDYKILWGVPNTAITEGFAFTFQDRTGSVLGQARRAPKEVTALQRFWEPFEIAGSALTEIRFYHWLYDNPDATPARMAEEIRSIGDAVWREHYARIFGPESHGLLSVYSHILTGDFYLADYPMGYVMAYQIRKFLEGKTLSAEMERMCAQGRIYPEQWMRGAVGSGISVEPLLRDTATALRRLGY